MKIKTLTQLRSETKRKVKLCYIAQELGISLSLVSSLLKGRRKHPSYDFVCFLAKLHNMEVNEMNKIIKERK